MTQSDKLTNHSNNFKIATKQNKIQPYHQSNIKLKILSQTQSQNPSIQKMMKKSHPIAMPNRPGTSKKSSPTQQIVSGMKKMSIQTKDFNAFNQDNLQIQKLYETIDQLILKQKQYQNTGKYVEAESCKRKVQALKQLAEKRQVEEIRERHQHELMQIEKAHIEEMNCFNIEWDKIVTELHQQIAKMEEDLIRRHEEQLQLVEEDINSQKPKNFKESPQLLNLRKIEQELARQENYMEAHQVQKKAEKLEKQQIEKWKKNNQSKGKSNLQVLKAKQQAQQSALRQKIQLAIDEKQRQRKIQEERLILKYENVIKQLRFQQNQELQKCEKIAKLSQYQKKTKVGQYGTTSRTSLA